MPFLIDIAAARAAYPEYKFIKALTPSAQKAAFHVQDSHGNDLCFKIISPDCSIDRIEREIAALQSITHPSIVRLREYTFSSKPGEHRHFMVEDYVDGKDLAEHLGPDKCWTRDRAADFFSALCIGLEELRKQNVVHRDLKPHNVRVRPDGSPVIIDFGLARLLNLPDLTSTAAGAAVETPLYFAPEQFSGTKHDIDHRTDLFALGVILYEALIGSHPFYRSGMSPADLSAATCTSTEWREHAGFKSLPKEWQVIVSRLLEKERGRRPHGAGAVSEILKKIRGI